MSWLDTLNPFMRLYAWLWHDVCGLDQPFSFYFVQWPWPLILGLGTTLLIVGIWRLENPTIRHWLIISGVMAWSFFMGHLYFPTMN